MKTLILGLDAFDPGMFEKLVEQGRLPNLRKYVGLGGYARFRISNPPQSEVSWTSIATGLDGGGHGMFDFVHRDPQTYTLMVSLLPTKSGVLGIQFTPPVRAKTLFDEAVSRGFPAASLWWPATFPAKIESPVKTLPGLGTPDIQGRLGVGTLYTLDHETSPSNLKTHLETLQPAGSGRYRGYLRGPRLKKRDGFQEAPLEFTLENLTEESARLVVGKQVVDLVQGKWSPIIELNFKAGFMVNIGAITRAILIQSAPHPRLYFLPLQIHPLHSPWHYASPKNYGIQTWKAAGPFLTLGWPQDTTGLEEGHISDDQFLELCDTIVLAQEQALKHHLQSFEEGVLAIVFDTLDRVQHMFWRDRPDIIEGWYEKLDGLVGRIEAVVKDKENTHLIAVSDHGFSNFDYKVHLNRWLVEGGYLIPNQDGERNGHPTANLRNVDWSKSQAYAAGLNSMYLNLEGREGQGSVGPAEKEAVQNKLREALLAWKGPDGKNVVAQVLFQKEAFQGILAEYGPDMLVGYVPGYRASAETGLGEWKARTLEPNKDHWGADHCYNADDVPGVIFSSRGLAGFPNPSFRDFPSFALDHEFQKGQADAPVAASSTEDQETLEERLRSLGYL